MCEVGVFRYKMIGFRHENNSTPGALIKEICNQQILEALTIL